MKTIRQTLLPVEVLWQYREFKRDEVAAPRLFYLHRHTTDEVTHYVDTQGMEPVELSIVKDRALLTDGNHRIVAAKRLGHQFIPVNVTVYFGNGSDSFYKHTLDRFLPITKTLELELKNLFLDRKLMKQMLREHEIIARDRRFELNCSALIWKSAETNPGA